MLNPNSTVIRVVRGVVCCSACAHRISRVSPNALILTGLAPKMRNVRAIYTIITRTHTRTHSEPPTQPSMWSNQRIQAHLGASSISLRYCSCLYTRAHTHTHTRGTAYTSVLWATSTSFPASISGADTSNSNTHTLTYPKRTRSHGEICFETHVAMLFKSNK